MRWAALIVLVACGDNAAAPDAAPAPCVATFTGNFDDTSTSTGCAQLPATELMLAIPSPVLGAPVGVAIDLGPVPTPGVYSSETTALWSALALRTVPTGGCVYIAGTDTVPHGSFTLTLSALTHGTLTLTLAVLAKVSEQGQESDCGAGATELVTLVF